MKRKANPWVRLVALLLIIVVFVCICSGCESHMAEDDKQWHAIVAMPDGSLVEGECSDSLAYSYGMVSVTIDGVEYRTHSSNVVRYREVSE